MSFKEQARRNDIRVPRLSRVIAAFGLPTRRVSIYLFPKKCTQRNVYVTNYWEKEIPLPYKCSPSKKTGIGIIL